MSERTDKPHKIANVLRAIGGKEYPRKFTSAIILAAGSSTRMGEGSTKQFLELEGIPIVARTVKAFDAAESVNEIIVVAKQDEISMYDNFCQKYGITKPFSVVAGGNTRQESARIGQDAVSKKAKFVCIHDAARCLITDELIVKVCRGAYLHGAAALAIKAVDTVKIVDKNVYIDSTPERKFTYQAQTPQVFPVNAYRAAAYVAKEEGLEVTDDCMLFEHIKIPVKLIEGSRENIKITEPIDMVFAKAILESRKEEK
ncbi:MAG: 2-C-methyl-D-erythritol 4-phosphate cytidylyltransferase [Ruminococcaceae bacterium]|nr:2-C-methyl-D-erythritol 4-phosphate cytidylyltransferase [Oscillospiraceae bacterium]